MCLLQRMLQRSGKQSRLHEFSDHNFGKEPILLKIKGKKRFNIVVVCAPIFNIVTFSSRIFCHDTIGQHYLKSHSHSILVESNQFSNNIFVHIILLVLSIVELYLTFIVSVYLTCDFAKHTLQYKLLNETRSSQAQIGENVRRYMWNLWLMVVHLWVSYIMLIN